MDREDKRHSRFHLENEPDDGMMPDDEQLVRLVEIVKEDPFAKFLDDASGNADAVGHRDVSAKRLSENDINEMLRPSNDPLPKRQGDVLAKDERVWRNDGDNGVGQREDPLDSNLFSDGNRGGWEHEHINADMGMYAEDYRTCVKTPARSYRISFILGISLCLAVAGAVISYSPWNNIDKKIEEIPIIRADVQSVKTTPAEPGGVQVPHQNKLVYNLVSGDKSSAKEKIVQREEQVVDAPIAVEAPALPSFATISHFDIDDTNYSGLSGGSKPEIAAENNVEEQSLTINKQGENTQESYGGGMPVPRKVHAVVLNQGNESNMAPPVAPYEKRTVEVPLPSVRTMEKNSDTVEQQVVKYSRKTQSTKQPTVGMRGAGTVKFVVQLAARRSEQMVINAYDEMRKHYPLLRSYDPLIQQVNLGEQGRYYRLRIGPLETRLDAEQLCAKLRDEGLSDCLVRQINNG